MKTIQIDTYRTARINAIIQQRQRFSSRIERDKANLSACKLALLNLSQHQSEFLARGVDATSAQRLGEINFEVINQIDGVLGLLEKLRYRCTRSTINIAVVGYARQGKSLLLQSLTGLNNKVIPDGSEGYCTGTLSKIVHQPGLKSAVAKVHFYSSNEFSLQVLAPYYETLGLATKSITVEEFALTPPPGLPLDKKNSEFDKARYGHLRRDYYSNIAKYRHLLGSPPIEIAEENIPQYVTQDSLDQSGNKIVNYLAVKDCVISCSFPHEDIGQISLLDLPGLGDTNLIEAERLIKILSEEADLILFVRRPEANAVWGEAYLKLYQIARDALSDFPLSKCSFMILNRSKHGAEGGDNGYRCQKLQAELKETPIRVAQCIIADCSNSQEAFAEVLEPILDYLAENVESIESEYGRSCQKQLDALYHNISTELDKASGALAKYGDGDLLFEQLFDRFWRRLTNDLENLLAELKENRDSLDSDFAQQVENAIQQCRTDTGIPATKEEIAERRHLFGSYNSAYNEFLHEIRTNFLGHFLSLDKAMQISLENRKDLVIKILKSYLGELGNAQEIDFLQIIYNLLPDNANNLKMGFQKLYEFDVSHAGRVIRLLRVNIDKLKPDTNSFLLSPAKQFPEEVTSELNIEEQILCTLQKLHQEAADKSETALHRILCEPSADAYFMLEEFVDRVLRAKDVQLEWRIFLRKECYQVWSEFRQIEQRVQQQLIWRTLVERAKEVNGLLVR
ncbi:dynamin family protein [Rivularia sp. UHCC 0363]|uniref:dynamin family protein n=1 Tax=Rivularia sp. UHCC 0363 TaxID=3110244 RepID=UPI002B1EEB75|nr:dynamin family protein [Rivularia sp. UHCC 0363]MEA5596631.1 dynamin family protein [Rivularia sp. UHCC 0363]